jgi:hypothetical protein
MQGIDGGVEIAVFLVQPGELSSEFALFFVGHELNREEFAKSWRFQLDHERDRFQYFRAGCRQKTATLFFIPLQANYCPCPRAAQAASRSLLTVHFPNPANMIDVLFCPIDSCLGSCKLTNSERI